MCYFIENDKRGVGLKEEIVKVKPLISSFRGSFVDFVDFVSKLERPYLAISKNEYEKVYQMAKHGIDNKPTDFVIFKGNIYTFGEADGGYALMPLVKREGNRVVNRFLSYCDNKGIDGLRILNSSFFTNADMMEV